MKHKGRGMSIAVIFIILFVSITATVFPFGFSRDQKDIVNLQTFVLSDFGDEIDQSNNMVWVAKFSRYAKPADTSKQMSDPDTNVCAPVYFEGKPLGLPQSMEKKQKYCLGVKAAYIKQGYNWIELYPIVLSGGVLDGNGKPMTSVIGHTGNNVLDDLGGKFTNLSKQATNVNLIGVVKSLDVWVWGGNYRYWLDFHLVDYKGFLHRLNAGDVNYVGWLNLRTRIPDYIPQTEYHVPFMKNLKLIMLKLWSYPNERVDQFYVYFDYMQVQTDVYEQRFNGDELGTNRW